MDGYGQFCPVAKAAEIVCQRWTPLILRELLVGSTHFNDIRRGVPRCSPTLLSKRLHELVRAGVIVHDSDDHAYRLTDQGAELLPIILGLGAWGQRWARTDYGPDELDPALLLWDVRRNLTLGAFGDATVTIRFAFPAQPPTRRFYWVVCDAHDIDLCVRDPGRDVDVDVEADLATLTRVWMGDVAFSAAVRGGQITLAGPTRITRRIPAWFGTNPHFAKIPAAGRSSPPRTDPMPSAYPAGIDRFFGTV